MARIDLRGRPICITGASSGIGRVTALQCAAAGMPVALMARRMAKLDQLAREIESQGGRAVDIHGDVTDASDCERLVATCIETFGGVYAMFANAGYGHEAAVMSMPDDEIRAIFETNFYGTLNTVRACVPHLRRAGEGHIIICSSCVARFPLPYFSVYSATKAAQHHISRAMGLELGPDGIHVSSVHPVGTRTEFFDTTRERSGGEDYALVDHTSERFMQRPEKVARAIVRCLRKPRPEVWTSPLVRYGMVLSGAVPRLADMGVRRMVRRRRLLDAQGKGDQGAGEP